MDPGSNANGSSSSSNATSSRKPVKADHGINPREAAGAQDNNNSVVETTSASPPPLPLTPADGGAAGTDPGNSPQVSAQGDQHKDQPSFNASDSPGVLDGQSHPQSNSPLPGSNGANAESTGRTTTPSNLERDLPPNSSSSVVPPVRRNSAGAILSSSSSSRKSASSPRSSPRTTSARRTPSPLHHISSRCRSPRGNLGVPVGGGSAASAFAKPAAAPAHGKRVAAPGSAILGRNSERRSPVSFIHPDKRASPQPMQQQHHHHHHRPKGKSPKNLLMGSTHTFDASAGTTSRSSSRVSSPSPKLVLSGGAQPSVARVPKVSTSSITSLPQSVVSGASAAAVHSAHSSAYVEASTLSYLRDDDQLRDPTPRELEFLTARPDDLDGPLDIGIEFSALGNANSSNYLTTPTHVTGQHMSAFGGGGTESTADTSGGGAGGGGDGATANARVSGGGGGGSSSARPESPVLPDMRGRHRSSSWDFGQAPLAGTAAGGGGGAGGGAGAGHAPAVPRTVGIDTEANIHGTAGSDGHTDNTGHANVTGATRRTSGGVPSNAQHMQQQQQQPQPQQQHGHRNSSMGPRPSVPLMQAQQQGQQHQPYYPNQQQQLLHHPQQPYQQPPQFQQHMPYHYDQTPYHHPHQYPQHPLMPQPQQHMHYQQHPQAAFHSQVPMLWQSQGQPLPAAMYGYAHPGIVEESGELANQVSAMSLAEIERLEQVLSMRKDSLLRSRPLGPTAAAAAAVVQQGGDGAVAGGSNTGNARGNQQMVLPHSQHQHQQQHGSGVDAQAYTTGDASVLTPQQQQPPQRYHPSQQQQQPQQQPQQQQQQHPSNGPPVAPAGETFGVPPMSSAEGRRQQQRVSGGKGGRKGRFLARSASPVFRRSVVRKPSRDDTDSIISEDFEDIDIGNGAPEDNPRPGSGFMAPDYKMFRSSQQPGTPTSAVSGEWGHNMSSGGGGGGGGGGRPIAINSSTSSSSARPEGSTRTMASSPGHLSFVNRLSRQPGEESAQAIKARTLKNASAAKHIAQQVNSQARAARGGGTNSSTAPNVGNEDDDDDDDDDDDVDGSMRMMDPMDGDSSAVNNSSHHHHNHRNNNNNNHNNNTDAYHHGNNKANDNDNNGVEEDEDLGLGGRDPTATPSPNGSIIIVASPKSAFVQQ